MPYIYISLYIHILGDLLYKPFSDTPIETGRAPTENAKLIRENDILLGG
jgi:hypothetical protein